MPLKDNDTMPDRGESAEVSQKRDAPRHVLDGLTPGRVRNDRNGCGWTGRQQLPYRLHDIGGHLFRWRTRLPDDVPCWGDDGKTTLTCRLRNACRQITPHLRKKGLHVCKEVDARHVGLKNIRRLWR